jgi:serine/threonine protein kinase/tetratricopeptide (TPR) repeat protein
MSGMLGGRYSIVRELSRGGGPATHYLAQDIQSRRTVAVAILHPGLTAAFDSERFLNEIRRASGLQHPHLLPIDECGRADQQVYYVSPYVDGECLRARLEREAQLPVEETVRLLGAVASALDYASRRGVLHLGITPEHILLRVDPAGGSVHPLLLNCGLLPALIAAGAPAEHTSGAPHYESPERGSGSTRPDSRSDIYALGCIGYEMLAGAPPFTGPTPEAIRARRAVDPVPSLRTLRPTVSETLALAIERALARAPARRFATGADFSEALGKGLRGSVKSTGRIKRARTGLAATLVIAAALTTLSLLRHQNRNVHEVVPSAARMAVLPFRSPERDTALVRLGRDLAATLSASLHGVGGIETADRLRIATETAGRDSLSLAEAAALAARLGASSMLFGSVVKDVERVRLRLDLFEIEDLTPVAEGIFVSAHPDSIRQLTDSAAWSVLREVWRRGQPPSPSLAGVTTRSLPALRAFLDGERDIASNRWDEAALAFRSAISADTSFWLAYARYVLVQMWRMTPVEPELLHAFRPHRTMLPERERLLIEPLLDSMLLSERIARQRAVTERFPDHWPGWFLYGDVLAHAGPRLGYDWIEAVQALRRAAALNPGLPAAWDHIYIVALVGGKDPEIASEASARLAELGSDMPDDQVLRLMEGVSKAEGLITPELDPLADSLAELMAARPATYITRHGPVGLPLQRAGYPAVQLELNRRALASRNFSLRPGLRQNLRANAAWAWAARGSWDSALTIMRQVAAERPGVIGPPRYSPPAHPPIGGPVLGIESYALAVLGAWLGVTPPALADERRPAAVAAIGPLPEEESRRDARGRMAWLDGILAYARADRRGLQQARRDAARSGYVQTPQLDRSLGAFEHALGGDRKRAGRELAALQEECAELENCNDYTPHIALHRLAAAQWLAEAGEGERARRLLRWQDAFVVWGEWLWVFSDVLAGPVYLARARLEESHGKPDKARFYFRRFLQIYDRPMPGQVHVVEEAKMALSRLSARVR